MVMVLGGVVYDALARVFAHAESEEIQAIGEHIVHVLVNLLFSLLYKEGRGTQLWRHKEPPPSPPPRHSNVS